MNKINKRYAFAIFFIVPTLWGPYHKSAASPPEKLAGPDIQNLSSPYSLPPHGNSTDVEQPSPTSSVPQQQHKENDLEHGRLREKRSPMKRKGGSTNTINTNDNINTIIDGVGGSSGREKTARTGSGYSRYSEEHKKEFLKNFSEKRKNGEATNVRQFANESNTDPDIAAGWVQEDQEQKLLSKYSDDLENGKDIPPMDLLNFAVESGITTSTAHQWLQKQKEQRQKEQKSPPTDQPSTSGIQQALQKADFLKNLPKELSESGGKIDLNDLARKKGIGVELAKGWWQEYLDKSGLLPPTATTTSGIQQQNQNNLNPPSPISWPKWIDDGIQQQNQNSLNPPSPISWPKWIDDGQQQPTPDIQQGNSSASKPSTSDTSQPTSDTSQPSTSSKQPQNASTRKKEKEERTKEREEFLEKLLEKLHDAQKNNKESFSVHEFAREKGKDPSKASTWWSRRNTEQVKKVKGQIEQLREQLQKPLKEQIKTLEDQMKQQYTELGEQQYQEQKEKQKELGVVPLPKQQKERLEQSWKQQKEHLGQQQQHLQQQKQELQQKLQQLQQQLREHPELQQLQQQLEQLEKLRKLTKAAT
ncbi:hypothetical protein [Pasteuria penetrans]|uniref:hypothetical protein n=1 Tax=Pasteuria penetrans TaxID=86005 RepID=UPI000FAECADB|nr:hypothetical protein [Pasteuria penetrans]